MITHFGLFWSERDVFWGKPNNPGVLLGRERMPLGRRGAPTISERRNAKDYRSYVGVYCLYGDGELVYVGEAGLDTRRNLYERLTSHRKGPMAGRWDHFSWFGRDSSEGECSVKVAFAQLEAVAIAVTNPGLNKQSGTFGGAVQVYQVPHEDAEGDLETKLDRISDTIRLLRNDG